MFVYADNAATTALSEEALSEMERGLKEIYGNPSSLHFKGREAEAALKEAREKIKTGNSRRESVFWKKKK